ncbi:MAG: DinB family protein, partial [Pseudomonadota bacterium]
FGSIMGTLSHLLWGDLTWMARFDTTLDKPGGTIAKSVGLVNDLRQWRAKRQDTDAAIINWAGGLTGEALVGDLLWFSGAASREVRRPLAFCVAHMFNHQTHHRGQLHAMMTDVGLKAPVSDLFLLPEVA